jgi:hypothetical protein
MPAVRCHMEVALDTRKLWVMMTLWRDATDMEVRLSDDAKLHRRGNRAQVLKNMVVGADHRRTSLQACIAEGEALLKFPAFSHKMTSFRQGATDGWKELQRLGPRESLADARSNRPVSALEAAPATGEVS